MSFGLVVTGAVAVLMAVTWTTSGHAGAGGALATERQATTEVQARDVEDHIRALVTSGADEQSVRALAGSAVQLGRATSHLPTP